VTVPLSAEGLDVDVYIDLVFVRVGRAVTPSIFVDVLTPFEEDLRAQLTDRVVRRLNVALT
jgi:hypothetical protein